MQFSLKYKKILRTQNTFSFAFSGGTTPIPIYQELSQQKISWENAAIFQTDERFINPENPESNQRLFQEYFVQNFPFFRERSIISKLRI